MFLAALSPCAGECFSTRHVTPCQGERCVPADDSQSVIDMYFVYEYLYLCMLFDVDASLLLYYYYLSVTIARLTSCATKTAYIGTLEIVNFYGAMLARF